MRRNILRILLLTTVITAASCSALSSNQKIPLHTNSTDTSRAANKTATNVPLTTTEKQENDIPKQTQTPTTIPTIAKPDPYVFETNTGDIDLSTGAIFISFDSGGLRGTIIATYLISPKNLGTYGSTKDALDYENHVTIIRPDTDQAMEVHTSVIRPEKNGNLMITIHSGYYNDRPLDAEILRFYIEKWGDEETDYVLNRLLKMIGSSGVLYSGESNLKAEVLGGIRLENNEALELNKYPENVLDIATKKKGGDYIALGNVEAFEELKNKEGHNIMLSFCGWGPDNNYSYYRYLVLLKITEN